MTLADCGSTLSAWQIIVGGIATGLVVVVIVAAMAWLVTR